jgi:nitrogen fixation/metabolism regulation signal transduction histidine kinase
VVARIDDRSSGALVKADVDQLVQACLNLMLNALEAIGGAAIVVGEGKIVIRISTMDNEVHLTFIDNGPGIPPQLLNRVLDPFVTTKATGTGLGLARVFAVAEGHGGYVDVRNAAEGGAVIDLVLPRHQEVEHASDHLDR